MSLFAIKWGLSKKYKIGFFDEITASRWFIFWHSNIVFLRPYLKQISSLPRSCFYDIEPLELIGIRLSSCWHNWMVLTCCVYTDEYCLLSLLTVFSLSFHRAAKVWPRGRPKKRRLVRIRPPLPPPANQHLNGISKSKDPPTTIDLLSRMKPNDVFLPFYTHCWSLKLLIIIIIIITLLRMSIFNTLCIVIIQLTTILNQYYYCWGGCDGPCHWLLDPTHFNLEASFRTNASLFQKD